ncbi:MAG TPA: hypothetical protein VGQ36_18540 [Thermoanaerobaculia bacterium]|jgi:hypothetical protein|nr:hypothetical protein [Thermoanaerobaculia bacterium]
MTERRLPAGFTAADLGQATADALAALVSFHSSPVVTGRAQTYVVFVLDAALQTNVASYRWQAGTDNVQTTNGVLEYVPAAEGDIEVRVDLVDAGNAVLKTMSVAQSVVTLHPELETLIQQPDEVAAVAADPETSRELVNDVRVYIDELAPRSADPESTLNRLLFAVAYAEALRVPPADRAAGIERLAAALDAGAAESFADQAQNGIGLCQVRPQALAMYVSATAGGSDWLIARRELPSDASARAPVQNELRTALQELAPDRQADLFNMLRFPKSNLRMTMQFLQALMTQYFAGMTLPAILADGSKAKTLVTQFKEGPFVVA